MKNIPAQNDPRDGERVSHKAEVIKDDEDAHFFKPVNLLNEQIVRVVEICFLEIFWEGPCEEEGSVVLFVRRNPGTEYGVDFWFITKIKNQVFNYRGAFVGIGDFYIYKGCEDAINEVPDDWAGDFRVPVKKIYDYLNTIHFFTRHETNLPVNPTFSNPGWQQIYAKNYRELAK